MAERGSKRRGVSRASCQVLGAGAAWLMAMSGLSSPPSAWAAEGVEAKSMLPPTFSCGQPLAGSDTLFTSCGGNQSNPANGAAKNAVDILTKILGGKASTIIPPRGPISIDTDCGKAPVTEADQLKCESMRTDGKFDPGKLQPFITQNATAVSNLSCKDNQFKALQGELGCLNNAATSLNQQIASLQSAFELQINGNGTPQNQGARGYFQQMKEYIAERKAQQEDVTKKLNGGDNGEKGLIPLQGEAQALIKSMPSAVQGLKESQKAMGIQRQALEEQTDTRTSGLAKECFVNKKDPTYICDRTTSGAKPVSLSEYIACSYEAFQRVGANGRRDDSSLNKARAAGMAGQLRSLLDQITSDFATSSSLPANAQDSQAGGDATYRIKSAPLAELYYADSLKRFTGTNPSVYDFVMKQIDQCFYQAERQVAVEKTKANSSIGQAQNAITKTEGDNSKQANDLLTEWSTQYTAAMKTLTGTHLPLDTAGCTDKKPEVQSSCLEELTKKYTGLINGSGKDAVAFDMKIHGTDAKMDVTFKCLGLAGCITQMQAKGTALKKEEARVTRQRQIQLTQFNNSVISCENRAAAAFNGQSTTLSNMVKKLNLTLGKLGVSGAVDIKPLTPCDPPEFDKEEGDSSGNGGQGVIQPPKNLVKDLGCRMNPPLIDVAGDSFGSANSALSSGVTKNDDDLAKAQKALTDATNKAAECVDADKKKAGDALEKARAKLREGLCIGNREYCPDTGGTSALQNLLDAANQVAGDLDAPTTDDSAGADTALTSPGMADLCKESNPLPKVCKKDAGGMATVRDKVELEDILKGTVCKDAGTDSNKRDDCKKTAIREHEESCADFPNPVPTAMPAICRKLKTSYADSHCSGESAASEMDTCLKKETAAARVKCDDWTTERTQSNGKSASECASVLGELKYKTEKGAKITGKGDGTAGEGK